MTIVEESLISNLLNLQQQLTWKIGYLCLHNRPPPKLVSSRITNHLVLLIILWLTGLSGTLRPWVVVAVAVVLQRCHTGWGIKMADSYGWESARCQFEGHCELLMEHLSSPSHGLTFSQHRGWAPRDKDVTGKILKVQPQNLWGTTLATLFWSK